MAHLGKQLSRGNRKRHYIAANNKEERVTHSQYQYGWNLTNAQTGAIYAETLATEQEIERLKAESSRLKRRLAELENERRVHNEFAKAFREAAIAAGVPLESLQVM